MSQVVRHYSLSLSLSLSMLYLVQLLFALCILLALNWWLKPLSIRPKNPSLRRWKVLKLFIWLDAGRSDGYQADSNNSSAFVATPTVSPNLRHKANSPEPARTDSDAVLLTDQRDVTSSASTAELANSDSEAALQSSCSVSPSDPETEGQPLKLSEHSPTGEQDQLKENSL